MNITQQLQEIIRKYNTVMENIDQWARAAGDRAYGGVVRSIKGAFLEDVAEKLVQIAWLSIKGNFDLLEINSKKISLPIRHEYINHIKEPELQDYLRANIADYVYKLSVDKHVFINGQFVLGIECKAYSENAMIKRILVDFAMLKSQHPNISCYLLQFESQLGGDYSALQTPVYGSRSTHTIQSYFACDLNIITLIAGERDVKRPIHTHFKPLTMDALQNAKTILANELRRFL